MQKHLGFAAAAALAVGAMASFGFAADDASVSGSVDTNANQSQTAADRASDRASDTADRAGNAAERTADKAGDAAKKILHGEGLKGTAMAPDAEGIRDVLAQVAEASLTKDGLDDVAERFVDADRNRLGDSLKEEDASYNDLVQRFQAEWKNKYGQDFNIKDEEKVFKPDTVQIVQGEVAENQARLAGEKSGAGVDVNADLDRNKATGDVNASANVDTGKTGLDVNGTGNAQAAADRNRNDAGRNTATVTIPESHGMPQVRIPMLHEMPDSWRVDIPDNIDGPALKSRITSALQKSLDQKDQWPSDVNDAYLAVTHDIFTQLFQGQAGSSNQPGSINQPGSAQPDSGATGTGSSGGSNSGNTSGNNAGGGLNQ